VVSSKQVTTRKLFVFNFHLSQYCTQNTVDEVTFFACFNR